MSGAYKYRPQYTQNQLGGSVEESQPPNLEDVPNSGICPHSHLNISFLKKLGHVVKKVGPTAVEIVLTAAFKDLGASQKR